jgi:hypothetical protein
VRAARREDAEQNYESGYDIPVRHGDLLRARSATRVPE